MRSGDSLVVDDEVRTAKLSKKKWGDHVRVAEEPELNHKLHVTFFSPVHLYRPIPLAMNSIIFELQWLDRTGLNKTRVRNDSSIYGSLVFGVWRQEAVLTW